MILQYLELKNFRLHKNTYLEFSRNLNYIVGGNGQGKTSLLEAIYYLCTSKNLLQSSDSEAVSFGDKFFEIKGLFENGSVSNVRILYDLEKGKKNIFLNGKQIYRSTEIIGKFPVVTLTQADHFITQGSPVYRRKLLDSIISQASQTYLKTLLEYNRVLKQRSSLLNKIKETGNPLLYEELEVWNKSLVVKGSEIIRKRVDFINEFNTYVKSAYKEVMGEREIPSIVYNSTVDIDDLNKLENNFERELVKRKNEEVIRSSNLIGPHRDDAVFKINDFELKRYGSQGQNKTFQISLKFAQFFYLKDKLNRTPIFLLDDVFGELDSERVEKISLFLKKIGQAFITLTDFTNIDNLIRDNEDIMIQVAEGETEYVS